MKMMKRSVFYAAVILFVVFAAIPALTHFGGVLAAPRTEPECSDTPELPVPSDTPRPPTATEITPTNPPPPTPRMDTETPIPVPTDTPVPVGEPTPTIEQPPLAEPTPYPGPSASPTAGQPPREKYPTVTPSPTPNKTMPVTGIGDITANMPPHVWFGLWLIACVILVAIIFGARKARMASPGGGTRQ